MINKGGWGIASGSPLVIDLREPASSAAIRVAEPPRAASAIRARDLACHLDFLWRFACRMGVGAAAAEDITHEAFVIALARLDAILPGKERSFLLSIVVHLIRRERQRWNRHEELTVEPPAREADRPDQVLDDKRARELLDRSLETLEEDLRLVFVLHEIEEETMADIAQLLEIAPGTVASRLRRAREQWKRATERLKRETLGPGRRT